MMTAAAIRETSVPIPAHAEAENQNGVDGNVDDVHDEGAEHGYFAVAHGAKQRRARVVYRHKGISGGGQQEIDESAGHHSALHLPKQQGKDVLAQNQRQYRQQGGGDHGGVEQLLGRRVGLLRLPAAQVLGYHDRSAGGQGGKDLDQQHVEPVHQGHAGYGRFPGGGHHNGIRHAHRHQQQLLDDQRDDQPQQRLPGKQRRAGL